MRYPLDFSHGSMASSKMSCKVLGSMPCSWRSSETRLSAVEKSVRTRVLRGDLAMTVASPQKIE